MKGYLLLLLVALAGVAFPFHAVVRWAIIENATVNVTVNQTTNQTIPTNVTNQSFVNASQMQLVSGYLIPQGDVGMLSGQYILRDNTTGQLILNISGYQQDQAAQMQRNFEMQNNQTMIAIGKLKESSFPALADMMEAALGGILVLGIFGAIGTIWAHTRQSSGEEDYTMKSDALEPSFAEKVAEEMGRRGNYDE